MKKAAKIGISVGSGLLVLLIISTTLNIWMKALVCHQLDQNIASADSLKITYGDIHVSVLTGKAWINEAYFCSDTACTWEQTTGEITECKIDKLSLDGINYFNWLARRRLNLRGLTVVKPSLHVRFQHDVKQQEGDVLQEQLEKERQARLEKILSVARIFIDDATLNRLTIDHAHVQAEAINDSLRVVIPEFSMRLYDLGYNIRDSLPHYNDSVFHFLIRNVEVNIPEVPMQLKVDELKAEPNGIIQIHQVWAKTFIDPAHKESIVTGVAKVTVGGFDVAKFNAVKQMDIKNIHLHQPYVNLRINENVQPSKTQKNQAQIEIDAINQKMMQSNMEVAKDFITGLTVDTILFHDITVEIRSISTKFFLQANRISTSLYGVGFSLIDQIPYHYNDSVYQLAIGNLDVITPDSAIAISAQNMHYDNGGAFSLGKTHIHHIVDKWQLAHLMGDVPATSIDMWIDTLRTSNKNIVKEAKNLGKGFYLDSVFTTIRSMHMFRDVRSKAKHPYVLPQTYLTQLSYPFVVHHVKADVQDIRINVAMSKQAVGRLDLGPVALHISNITPIHDSTITAVAKGKMGKASIEAGFDMKVNQACDWKIKLNAKNLDMHHLDNLIYPLVGMKIGCDVHRIQAQYGGDVKEAKGTFCMEYDDIDIFADKNSDPPIRAVRDLSGLINSAGKTLVNKSNPTIPGEDPIAYQVKWKNDIWEDPSMFYIGPVIDGCIKTMLPGLFLSARVKDGQSAFKKSTQTNKH